jgi:hypothetical protein
MNMPRRNRKVDAAKYKNMIADKLVLINRRHFMNFI